MKKGPVDIKNLLTLVNFWQTEFSSQLASVVVVVFFVTNGLNTFPPLLLLTYLRTLSPTFFPLSHLQCDQIGRFLKVLGAYYLSKVARPNVW